MFFSRPRGAVLALGVASVLTTTACQASDAATAPPGGLTVLAAFYPLQYAAERVGGDLVVVDNLTPPGAEPHDLELSPRDVGRLVDADLVVYLDGFQPALDDAVSTEAADHAFDAHEAAHLDLSAAEEDEGHAEDDGHAHGAADPHFWLDPLRLADVGDALADRMAQAAPDDATTFRANAADLRADLEQLDGELTAGLADCAHRELVTGHEAFGYLAERYGFTQVGIAGLSPDSEPSAADLARVSDLVASTGTTTVYTETLVSPDVADAVAAEAGVATAVLDPLEGLTDASAGDDYLGVMRANLATLQAGQDCA